MDIGDSVEVVSKVSYKHYKHTGKIIKECNSKWKRMFIVEFNDNTKAKFYTDSLKVITINSDVFQGICIFKKTIELSF